MGVKWNRDIIFISNTNRYEKEVTTWGVVMGEKLPGRFELYTILSVSASGTVKVYPK